MSSLENIIGVEEAAPLLGLSPGTLKNYCRERKIQAKKIGRDWVLDKTNLLINTGGRKMRDIRSLNNVFFNGMMLHSVAGIDSKENNIFSCFYANVTESPQESSNHFRVYWDLNGFFSDEEKQKFDWPNPHAASLVGDDQKENTIEYFSQYPALNKEMTIYDRQIKVLSRPVRQSPTSFDLIYWACAIDNQDRVYKVYWNVINLHEPFKIEMTVDKKRYCKKCLQHWGLNNRPCVDEAGHEYVRNQ